jgi:hypothetical protein
MNTRGSNFARWARWWVTSATLAACSTTPPVADGGSDAAAIDAATPMETGAQDAAVIEDSALDAQREASASDADAGPSDTGASPSDAGTGEAGATVSLDALSGQIAGDVCAALFRCCASEQDLNAYFAPYVASNRLASVRSRLPPMVAPAAFTEAQCRSALSDAFAITPWADWVSAARAGRVSYDGAAAGACSAQLARASCGRPVWDALTDPRCFGFSPGTGDVQRSFFRRTQAAGAACSYVRDGAGGVFFGTCDPTQAFCCFESGGRCTVVPNAMLPAAMGTCRAAGAVGESCTIAPALRVCRTGLECDGSGRCAAPRTGTLASLAPCWSAADGLLGDCPAGEFCDLFGASRCSPLRAQGALCSGGDQCASAFCQCPSTGCTASADGSFVEVGRCAPWGLCTMR